MPLIPKGPVGTNIARGLLTQPILFPSAPMCSRGERWGAYKGNRGERWGACCAVRYPLCCETKIIIQASEFFRCYIYDISLYIYDIYYIYILYI